MDVLQHANVIMIGSLERQIYVQALDNTLRQNNELGMFDILPSDTSGVLVMNASPWNPERSMILATGKTTEGEMLASVQLLSTSPLTDVQTRGAIVDAGGVTPYAGFDNLSLSSVSVSVSSATISINPTIRLSQNYDRVTATIGSAAVFKGAAWWDSRPTNRIYATVSTAPCWSPRQLRGAQCARFWGKERRHYR